MQGTGSLYIWDFDVLFSGTGLATFGANEQTASVTFAGVGYCLPNANTDYGRASLPALAGQGGEGVYAYGSGEVPALFAYGEDSTYIPAVPQYGYGVFPGLWGAGTVKTSSGAEGTGYVPVLAGQGGEGDYGHGGGMVPALQGYGVDDLMPGYAPVVSMGYAFTGIVGTMDMLVAINNLGQIVDTITAERELLAQFVEAATAEGTLAAVGDFFVTIDESGVVSFFSTSSVGDRASLDDTARVWVVNVDTGATSQYDGYGFNSFFEDDGKYYGVAEDGIYLLEGEDDYGQDIDGLVEYGRNNLGSMQRKQVPNVYAGVSSAGNMLLKVEADGREFIYEARAGSSDMMNQRFDIGRGLVGAYWNFTLLNRSGDDFELDGISFEPIVLTRKI